MSNCDEEALQKLYVEDGLDQEEIADKFGVNQTTISRWINNHEIKQPLKNPNLLRKKYWDEGKSLRQIADEIGSYAGSVCKAMERHGIERRQSTTDKVPHFSHADAGGYERWRHMVDGTKHTVSIHRLICVAEYGIDKVKDMDVHHTNGVPWDNRPDNLELLTREEHNKVHINERDSRGRFTS